ncbi:MAG TPA: nucleotide exchange factor GrpE [Phycisphaerae bacterium]|nr:nucleotide exchange factor GrpE [Phycisphaerae bacterium]
MTGKKSKIVVPSEEEVARYASSGSSGESTGAGGPAEQPPSNDKPAAEAPQPQTAGREETVDLLRAELALCKDKLLRAHAECDNIAKRLNQQHAESLKLAGMDLARALLPVLDNMQRTLDNLKDAHADDPVIQGVKLIAEQFAKVLQDHGVVPIQSVGEPFDPACHEALMEDRQSDLPAGTVTMEMQRGYKMHDRVLRPARVAVAGQKEDGTNQESPRAEDGETEE